MNDEEKAYFYAVCFVLVFGCAFGSVLSHASCVENSRSCYCCSDTFPYVSAHNDLRVMCTSYTEIRILDVCDSSWNLPNYLFAALCTVLSFYKLWQYRGEFNSNYTYAYISIFLTFVGYIDVLTFARIQSCHTFPGHGECQKYDDHV